MGENARNYKRTTIRRLDTLSCNKCYNPNCNKQLIAYDNTTIISKICHIEAASNYGPRFNIQMDDNERLSFENLILLCDECHCVIDNINNIKKFPVKLLKEWKKNHENKGVYEHLKNPCLLRLAVKAISEIEFNNPGLVEHHDLKSFNIPKKINYNSIKRNKFLIEEYKVYYGQINSLYEELEKQGSFKKENILRNIKNIYLKTKGKYILDANNETEMLCKNSDNIIDDIEEELLNLIDSSKSNTFSFEISIIMVDAFMRCKILEGPE